MGLGLKDGSFSDINFNYEQETLDITPPPQIKNGSTLSIGNSDGNRFIMIVDQHFNWLQKKMIKWLLGVTVKNYRN